MESNRFLLAVAIVAVAFSALGFSSTYSSVSSFGDLLTGHLIENGTINLTIEPSTAINITHSNGSLGKDLNWGTGQVNAGEDNAILVSNGTVQRGTWSAVTEGFRIENIGNTDVTNLTVHADKDAAEFIGHASAGFEYNLSNYEENSCNDWEAGIANTYNTFNTGPVEVCNNFTSDNDADVLQMDIRLIIPSDASDGSKTNIVRLTYE